MAKLKLVAAPAFKAGVSIPVAGGPDVEIGFTFVHRTKDDMQAFMESREGRSDVQSCMDMVSDWDFDEPLNADNMALLLQNYIGAPVAIYRTYVEQLTKAKLGN